MRNLRDQEIYDNELRRQAQVDRENSSAAGGVAVGIAIAGLIGAGIAAYFFMNRQPEAQTPGQTTIIQRTREIVPVPQPQSPTQAPDINITVPNPAPVNPAPASESTQPDTQQTQNEQPAANPAASDSQSNSAAPAAEEP